MCVCLLRLSVCRCNGSCLLYVLVVCAFVCFIVLRNCGCLLLLVCLCCLFVVGFFGRRVFVVCFVVVLCVFVLLCSCLCLLF